MPTDAVKVPVRPSTGPPLRSAVRRCHDRERLMLSLRRETGEVGNLERR
jgi:hypothetical protein